MRPNQPRPVTPAKKHMAYNHNPPGQNGQLSIDRVFPPRSSPPPVMYDPTIARDKDILGRTSKERIFPDRNTLTTPLIRGVKIVDDPPGQAGEPSRERIFPLFQEGRLKHLLETKEPQGKWKMECYRCHPLSSILFLSKLKIFMDHSPTGRRRTLMIEMPKTNVALSGLARTL